MSGRASRFAPALRRVARELDLPRGVRAAILLEMAADLDALYEHHRENGAGEEEAARRAEEAVLGSSEVVRRLGRLHRGTWRSWSEGVGARLGGGADLVLLVVGVAPVFVVAGAAAAHMLAGPVPPLGWAVLAAGAMMAGLAVFEAGRLVGGEAGRSRGVPLLLLLSAVAPALGALALLLGAYVAAGELAAGDPDAAARIAIAERVGRAAVVLLIGLLLGLAGALSWFILEGRASARAARDVEKLLCDDAPSAPEPRSADVLPLVRGRRP